MSDLFEVEEQVNEGSEWRGTINVGDNELCYRNLENEEFAEVLSTMGHDKFEKLEEELRSDKNDLDEEDMAQLRKLQTKKDEGRLKDDEEEQLESLQQEIQSSNINMFFLLEPDVVDGLQRAAELGIVGDEEDARKVMDMSPTEQRDRFNEVVTEYDDAKELVDEHAKNFVRKDTEQIMFEAGIKVLVGKGN